MWRRPPKAADSIPGTGQSGAIIPGPFPLVRHFIVGSVFVILAALTIVNMISSSVERSIVESRLEQEAEDAARIIAFSLAERISPNTMTVDPGSPDLFMDRAAMNRIALNVVRGQPVMRLDILSPDGAVGYSTDPSIVSSDARESESPEQLERVIQSGVTSRYLPDRSLTLVSGQSGQFDLVETIIPLHHEAAAGSATDEPYAVLVVYRDVTAGIDAATAEGSRFRLFTIAGTMCAMFLALLWIVSRGQRFTERIRRRLAEMLERERDLRTELDRRNADLTEANDAKNRFLSAVSHELKTPLTSIIAFTDILRRDRDGNLSERQIRHLDVMKRSGVQLKLLIDDLLDLSRIQAGNFNLKPELFNVQPLLAEVSEGMEPILGERGQRLIISAPVSPLTIKADRGRILQVITNLVSNASKYSDDGSQVQIEAAMSDGNVIVVVEDHGIGMSAEDTQRLFTAFFRSDNPAVRKVPGTGLGLVIARSIVEMHNGMLNLESELGQGTKVWFTLPLAHDATAPGRDEPDDKHEPGSELQSAA
ncbi:MAG: HAMP domain-containing sensor histidine kinase [Dehalococcoidia bacterium]